MEMQLEKQKNQLSLSDREFSLCKEIYHINQLAPFPLDDNKIQEWARSIEDILPELNLDHLKDLISDFKRGKIEYDKNLGIQNIFTGLVSKFGMIYDK